MESSAWHSLHCRLPTYSYLLFDSVMIDKRRIDKEKIKIFPGFFKVFVRLYNIRMNINHPQSRYLKKKKSQGILGIDRVLKICIDFAHKM